MIKTKVELDEIDNKIWDNSRKNDLTKWEKWRNKKWVGVKSEIKFLEKQLESINERLDRLDFVNDQDMVLDIEWFLKELSKIIELRIKELEGKK